PKVLRLYDAERFAATLEDAIAETMKSCCFQILGATHSKLFRDSLQEFSGRIVGVSHRQNLISPAVALPNQASNALGKHRGLTSARTGHHQHGAVNVLNRFALPIVQFEWLACSLRNEGRGITKKIQLRRRNGRSAAGRDHWDQESWQHYVGEGEERQPRNGEKTPLANAVADQQIVARRTGVLLSVCSGAVLSVSIR